jgi:hypothetical protein
MKKKWYLKFARFFKGAIVDQHIGTLVPKNANIEYFANATNQQFCKHL